MSPLIYLFLGHFLADYLFQWNELVTYKQKKIGGVLLHSLIHLITNAALLAPFMYLKEVQMGVLTLFVIHFTMDEAKIILQGRHPQWNRFWVYFGDQIFHFISIVAVALGMIGWQEVVMTEPARSYYTNWLLVFYILTLVLVTYFWDVTRWTYNNSKKQQPYQRDYPGMLKNAVAITVLFAAYLIIW